LDFLQAIYRDPTQPIQRRLRAASAALPFEHPKLAVVANVRQEDLAERLANALAATGKVINGRAVQVLRSPGPLNAHRSYLASGFSKRRF
jgi:hypothetical protein